MSELAGVRDVDHPTYGRIKVFGGNDVVSRHVEGGAEWERHLIDIAIPHVRPGYDVVDAGANLGFFALGLLAAGGRPRRVHCFEPRADAMALLQHNVEDRPEIVTYGFGLSDRTRMPPYEKTLDNVGGTRIGLGSRHRCATLALDSVRTLFEAPVSLVKIDVEAHELELLLGARRFFAEHRPELILIESFEENHAAVDAELVRLGYVLRERHGRWDHVYERAAK